MEITRNISGYFFNCTLSYNEGKFTMLIFGQKEPSKYIWVVDQPKTLTMNVVNSNSKKIELELTPYQIYNIFTDGLNGSGLISVQQNHDKKVMHVTVNFSFFGLSCQCTFKLNKVYDEIDELHSRLNDYKYTPFEYQQKLQELENKLKAKEEELLVLKNKHKANYAMLIEKVKEL